MHHKLAETPCLINKYSAHQSTNTHVVVTTSHDYDYQYPILLYVAAASAVYIYYRSLTLIRGGLLLHLLGTFETILSGLRHRKDLRIRRSNGSASSTIMVMHLIEFLCETHFGGEVIAYSAIHPIIRKGFKDEDLGSSSGWWAGRYCSYLLPKQAHTTYQEKHNEIL